MRVERIAKAFHESYERLAPDFGYKTRKASAKPWEDVSQQNRDLMAAVVQDLLDQGVIQKRPPPIKPGHGRDLWEKP